MFSLLLFYSYLAFALLYSALPFSCSCYSCVERHSGVGVIQARIRFNLPSLPILNYTSKKCPNYFSWEMRIMNIIVNRRKHFKIRYPQSDRNYGRANNWIVLCTWIIITKEIINICIVFNRITSGRLVTSFVTFWKQSEVFFFSFLGSGPEGDDVL